MNKNVKRWILHGALFALTFITATLVQGPVYAATIMTILLAHEMGHYLMCRKYGVEATFPVFIPMPNILGTMGAVISMKSPMPNRKALFDVGVAGPLAGLVLAIPAIVIGLQFSEIKVIPQGAPGLFLGEPLLFKFFSNLIIGELPSGYDVFLHPVAFAGWAMLFVTSVNLFPAGQLDGGHIMFALLGKRAKYVSWLTAAAFLYMGFKYQPMWFVYAVLLLLFALRHPAPIDDTTPLDRKRVLLALFTYALLIVCFVPVPFDFRM